MRMLKWTTVKRPFLTGLVIIPSILIATIGDKHIDITVRRTEIGQTAIGGATHQRGCEVTQDAGHVPVIGIFLVLAPQHRQHHFPFTLLEQTELRGERP